MIKYIFSRKDTKKYALPGGVCCLYPDSPTGRLSAALVEQTGRYPEKGFRVNDYCTEAMFIMRGNFIITLNGHKKKLKVNDLAYIPPHTPYSIRGKGTVFVFIEPKWNSAQNHQENEENKKPGTISGTGD